jgi:hypothetical protein
MCGLVAIAASHRSPHLIEVRERVRINGVPLSQEDFCSVFWDVYDDLNKTGYAAMPLDIRAAIAFADQVLVTTTLTLSKFRFRLPVAPRMAMNSGLPTSVPLRSLPSR